MKYKRHLCALLSGALLAGLCGCAPTQLPLVVAVPQGAPVQLRRTVEQASDGVKVEFVELPDFSHSEEDEASRQLVQLRTELMAGEGPDLLLLSSSQQLFPDLAKSALSGAFCDLAPFLDQTLAGMDLLDPVLDAGVWEGKRYILPLGFQIEGVEMQQEVWEEVSGKDTPAAFLGTLSRLSQPPVQTFYFNIQYSREASLLDHTSKTLQLEQLREVYRMVSEWQAAGLEEASLDSGAVFEAEILDGSEAKTAREGTQCAAIPNGADGFTAYPVLMGAVRANSAYARQAAQILLGLLSSPEQDGDGGSGTVLGLPMLPLERSALEQVAGERPEVVQAAEQVNHAILPCSQETRLFAYMMAAAAEGADFDQTVEHLQQEYRYYFDE